MSGADVVVSVGHPPGGRGHVQEAGHRGCSRPPNTFVLQKKLRSELKFLDLSALVNLKKINPNG